ncbi:hypothetical protein AAE478_004819 [Parahypoxylon ruwenzoriense]
MAAAKLSHLERTATEPRDKSLHTVTLAEINEINDQIRLFRLELSTPLRFLPGQWLDVFVPGISKAGGYTITSSPLRARPSASSLSSKDALYLELAVQKSPDPPAAWLWQDADAITYADLRVRVGGSFVWPPPGVNTRALRRAVFVAGGVGVNPLVSMLSSLAEGSDPPPFEVRFLYSLRDDTTAGPRRASRMLFVERLAEILGPRGRVRGQLQLFLTGAGEHQGVVCCGGGGDGKDEEETNVHFLGRRMTVDDVAAAAGDSSERRFAVVYVCGVPTMTDEFVQQFTDPGGLGMEPHRVLCEKWW